MDDGKYIIPGIENVRGPNNAHKLTIYDKEVIMPLSRTKINGKEYPCPNDYDYYLTTLYSAQYSQLPPAIKIHPRLERLSKYPNIDESFKSALKLMGQINNDFK